MGTKRRSFSREFKLEAVRQVLETDASIGQVSRALDLDNSVLSRWVRQVQEDAGQAFPGKGHQTDEAEELRRLRRELADVREERDILKKTVAIFSDRKPK